MVSVFCAVFFTPLIFSSFKNIREKPWYVPSRRLVIQETVFRVPDLTPLLYVQGGVTKLAKMSVVELKNLMKDDLKMCLAQQIDIEDWTDKCGKCGYPKLLHKEQHREAACTKEQ